MAGVLSEILTVKNFYDLSGVHNGNPFADTAYYSQIMADKHICQLQLLLQPDQ